MVTGREIVEHDDRRPLCAQRLYRVAPDVAGASGNQHSAHGRPIET